MEDARQAEISDSLRIFLLECWKNWNVLNVWNDWNCPNIL